MGREMWPRRVYGRDRRGGGFGELGMADFTMTMLMLVPVGGDFTGVEVVSNIIDVVKYYGTIGRVHMWDVARTGSLYEG